MNSGLTPLFNAWLLCNRWCRTKLKIFNKNRVILKHMKGIPKSIIITVSCLLVGVAIAHPIQKKLEEKQWRESAEKRNIESKHSALEGEKQDFEGIIHTLLFISGDDTVRGYGGTEGKLDMVARKKYFSEKGWVKYQTFVAQQKKDIEKLGTDSRAPYSCHENFNYKSQSYISIDQHQKFSAEGYFLCGAWDSFTQTGKYKINVLIIGNANDAKNIIIDDWSVEIIEPIGVK